MSAPPVDNDKTGLSDRDIAKRRDETLKRMLKTPPKPHSEMTGDSKKKPTGKNNPAK